MTDTEPSATTGGPPPLPAGVADERFAVNVRETRERQGMSQAEVARQMAGRGWSWHPQTVQKVEGGHRKVSVGEAEALSRILGTTIDRLTWPGQAVSAATLLDVTIARAGQALEQISAWTSVLMHARRQLETSAGEAEKRDFLGSDHIRELAAEAREYIAAEPEAAVERGRRDYASLLDPGDGGEGEYPVPVRAEEAAG